MHQDTDLIPTANALLVQLRSLRDACVCMESAHAARLTTMSAEHQASARNFLHYLALRQQDIRPLQYTLASLGLSSLGVIEAHVMASLNAVIARLENLLGHETIHAPTPPVSFRGGSASLKAHADALLGTPSDGREVAVMVTLPSEAADDPALIRALLQGGMDVARINCAHDDAAAWQRMAQHVRQIAAELNRTCRIQIDLAGPKSRTGNLRVLGRMLRLKVKRDWHNKLLQPALLWLSDAEQPLRFAQSGVQQPADGQPAELVFHGQGLTHLHVDDTLTLHDARGRRREGRVVRSHTHGVLLAFDDNVLIEEGCAIEGGRHKHRIQGSLHGAPEVQEELRLCVNDTLILTREDLPGHAAVRDEHGTVTAPAQIHCTLEAAFSDAQAGQSVWLDDGRIGAMIEDVTTERITLRITHALPEGSKLKAEKGINFPDTVFHTPALTEKDRADLTAMHAHCDLLAMSFVREESDIQQLQQALAALGAEHLGVVLKIENRRAFENLPKLLLAAMHSPQLGVMVARGDLAVELGFERLSEAQEEIVWLCEAAHVPVIWATQILESMAKSGAPSRPEVTDAAIGIRAECVMLNKGPHIVQALEFLQRVLARMEGHYDKRMATLRRLSIAGAMTTE